MKKNTKNLLFVLMAIIPFITSCSLFPVKQMSVSDMNLLSKNVYNSIVSNYEDYDMIEISKMEIFSNDFFFSKVEIYDSFYLEGTLDQSIVPFFGEELVGNDVSYIFALLGFYDAQGQKALYEEEVMIIKCGETIYSFINPDGVYHAEKFGLVEDLKFASYVFLTLNRVTKNYQKMKKFTNLNNRFDTRNIQ